jgi:hypothetical protein
MLGRIHSLRTSSRSRSTWSQRTKPILPPSPPYCKDGGQGAVVCSWCWPREGVSGSRIVLVPLMNLAWVGGRVGRGAEVRSAAIGGDGFHLCPSRSSSPSKGSVLLLLLLIEDHFGGFKILRSIRSSPEAFWPRTKSDCPFSPTYVPPS